MLSIKDYAQQKNITYEAVRKQVKRYQDELEGHIEKVHRTQYLDDYAVQFLDEKRAASPIVILEKSKDEELQRLQEENRLLLLKVAELQDRLLQEKEVVQQLQSEKIEMLAEINKPEDVQKQDIKQLQVQQQRAEQAEERERQAQADLQNLKEAAEAEIQRLKEEAEAMQRDFDAEKERPLTWRERLFGRK